MTSRRSAALPPLPALLIRGVATWFRQKALALPDTGLMAHFSVADIDMAHVARFRNFFDDRGTHVPLSYFYLMAQRAQLALMLDERFPHAIPGLIHSKNELRRHATPEATAGFTLAVSAIPVRAAGAARKIAFSVEISQSDRSVVSCSSEYRLPGQNRPPSARPAGPDQFPASFAQYDWACEPQVIRRYAMLSGDYNPIHLSSRLARRFGFQRALAHGMYSVGRAAAGIECQTRRTVIAISAEFRRPIYLPARAIFGFDAQNATQGGYGVLLADEQKLALSGRWETAAI